MKRKLDRPTVLGPIVSGIRRLGRSSSPLCVGLFAFSLTPLAGADPAPVPPQDAAVRPPLQAAAPLSIQATPAATLVAKASPFPAVAEEPRPVPAETMKLAAVPESPKLAAPPAVEAPRPAAEAPKPQAAPVPPTAAPPAAPAPAAVHPAPPVPAPAAPAGPSAQERLEQLRKAADMLIEVNAALGAPRSPYGQIIYDIAVRHSINPQLVAALIHVESAFNPRAVSRKGAYGLMQLLPETARRFGVHRKRDLLNPVKNLEAGVKYLKWLTERFGGDVQKTLAAYNAGEGAVDRFGGIPPYHETQQYVQRIFGLLGIVTPEPDPAPAAPAPTAAAPVDVVPAGR
ncbi:MAG TPA: lytic transglycosylase domain-containing protein [Thermoanaerobaculia bacterium]|nr:lytic transglycosylase domain-containing protein [Thermoanaerobaculia bacterium]